jgi:hypothetical protein
MLACDGGGAPPSLDAATGVADASVDAAVVAPGTCAVVGATRIELPSNLESYPTIRRLLGGFVLSASGRCRESGGDFLFSFTPGAASSQLSVPPSIDHALCSVPVADDSSHPAVLVTAWRGRPMALLDELIATAWRGTPPIAGMTHTIGEAYFRGTAEHDGAPSFDGKRAVITSGHVAVDVPDAFMVGLDGKRVGDAASLGFGAASPTFGCLAVTPTEHGAAVSALDHEGDEVFRVVELGADGAVVQTIAQPAAGGNGCPLVVSSPTGLLVALPRAGQSYQVVALSAGQVHALPAPNAPTGTPRWLRTDGDGGLLWLESTETFPLRMLHVSMVGSTRVLSDDLGAGGVLPGEAGRLFLTRAVEAGTQRIDEIACAL